MTGVVAGGAAALLLVAVAGVARPRPPVRRPAPRTSARRVSVRTGAVRRLVVAAVPIALGFAIGGPALAVAAAMGRMIWRRFAPRRAAGRERRRVASDFPDAIDLFVLAVGAGLTPRQAIGQVAVLAPASIRPGFDAVVARLARGDVLADALRALDDRLGPVAAPLTTLVGSADRHGLPLAPVLDTLSTEARASRRRLDEAAARALPVRLSFPLVVCTLPSFVLLAIVPAVLAALSSLGADAW